MTRLRVTLTVLPLAALILGAAPSAQAFGYGPFFEYNRAFVDSAFGIDYNIYAVGISIDTNVAKNRLFNYRLNVGYQWDEFSARGLSLDNVFGFGVLRTRAVRLWLGPSIRLGADSIGGTSRVQLVAGGGAALGVNLHTGNVGSAAITLGYQYVHVETVTTSFGSSAGRQEHRMDLKFTYFFRTSGDRFADRPPLADPGL